MIDYVWFSHRGYIYDVELKRSKKAFYKNTNPILDWDNCRVYAMSRSDKQIRVMVRRSENVYSSYMKSNVKIRYMYSFDASSIYEPREDYYELHDANHSLRRWVIQLDDDYWIWQVADDKGIENSKIYSIYKMLKKKLEEPDLSKDSIFDLDIDSDDRIIPVIYQPTIDALNNFLREIHCHKLNENEIEVTLLFNNEQLREHAIANPIYEFFRRIIYGRSIDVETFRILIDGIPKYFQFANIYSNGNGIEQDDIHADKPDLYGNVRKHEIKYYLLNYNHPIVFINTSNHAMAEYDSNPRLWKWEYIAWDDHSPVVYGERSRKCIERSFKPFWRILLDYLIKRY